MPQNRLQIVTCKSSPPPPPTYPHVTNNGNMGDTLLAGYTFQEKFLTLCNNIKKNVLNRCNISNLIDELNLIRFLKSCQILKTSWFHFENGTRRVGSVTLIFDQTTNSHQIMQGIRDHSISSFANNPNCKIEFMDHFRENGTKVAKKCIFERV